MLPKERYVHSLKKKYRSQKLCSLPSPHHIDHSGFRLDNETGRSYCEYNSDYSNRIRRSIHNPS